MAGLGARHAAAVTPVPGTLPPSTQATINNGAGDQTDPHVSGNLVSYTSQLAATSEIRYFNFASGTDAAIASGGGFDFLSDVSGSTIVFSRVIGGKGAMYAFDAATGGPAVELDPQAGSNRPGVGIGDGTVAWIDVSFGGGELFAHDRIGGSTQRLSSEAASDRRPQVSPDGNVIAREKCTSLGAGCDV